MRKIREILKKSAVAALAAVLITTSVPTGVLAEEVTEDITAAADDRAVSENVPEDTIAAAGDTAGSEEVKEGSDEDEPSDEKTGEMVSENKVSENKAPAFEESKTIGDVTITVSAEEGVFPEDAELSVKKADRVKEEQAEDAVNEVRDENVNVAASYTYDIKVLDKDGEEIEPEDESKVHVSFTLNEVADENLSTNIYHITESDDTGLSTIEEAGGGTPADEGDEGNATDEVLNAEQLPVETDGTTATAETDGFSLYTVEFTYENKQYVMPGDTTIGLSEILDTVGLTGEVTDVRVSDEDLFSASDETGEWIVTAHKAFSSNEWMKVRINGVDYEITVTDDQGNTITITSPVTINSSNRSQYNGKTLTGTYNPSMDLFDNSKRGAIIIDGGTTSLTINDLNINIPGDGEKNVSGILLRNNATLNLTIQGTNSFYAAGDGAGICVPKGCTLNITESSKGSLIAEGGCNTDETAAHGGAGIGAEGTNDDGVGTINIKGGTITAIGGSTRLATEIGAAGIGGSIESKDTGIINISGGNVTAKAHYGNAAIGGAYCGRVESITISGGTVTATVSNGSSRGASIGCGTNGNTVDKLSCGTIEITGGKVTANGNIGYGGDIDGSGAGAGYAGGSVNIGKEVVATAVLNVKCDSWEQKASIEFEANGGTGSMGPYILDLRSSNRYNLPSSCEFTRDDYIFTGWQIGSKKYDPGEQVVIAGHTLVKPVWASSALANLNNAEYVVSDNKEFNDKRIEVTGDSTLTLSAGTTLTVGQGIHVPGGSTLTIKGEGSLIVTGEDHAAIGGNMGGNESCGTIIIEGGNIEAKAKGSADVGIGVAYNGKSSGEVIINGGNITAAGGFGAPAIGGIGTSVTINGGIVDAKTEEKSNSPAIGGLDSGTAGTVTINGGQVTVSGGYGIGKGKSGSGGNIILGWTDTSDFIKSNKYNGSVTFRDGFLLEDGETVATKDNIEGKKLIPASLVSIGQFSGGSVSGAGTYKIGSTVTLTASPNENYELESITAAKTGDPSTSVTLSGTGNIRKFTAPPYGVTVTAGFRGTLPAAAPTIKTQPGNIELATGYTSGNISVAAKPANDTTYKSLTYQWYSNTTESNEGGSAVSGATGAEFTIPTGKTEGTYYYYCVVTATRKDNGRTATTTSNVAKVKVSKTKVYIASDVTAQNRVYNGSKAAGIIGTGVLKRVKDDTVVSGLTTSSISAEFVDKKAGTGKAVSITGATLSGTDAENYTLDIDKTNRTLALTSNISKKTVKITGLTVSNKEYDGTRDAIISGNAGIEGVIGSDDVSISAGAAKFADANAGDGKTVTFSGFALSGTDAGNYELISQPEGVTADITKRSVTITAKDQSVELNKNIATGTGQVDLSGGLATGQTLSAVTLQSSSTAAITTSGTITPGAAVIKSGTADVTANYNITYQNGTLTVTKIKAVVKKAPTVKSLTYSGLDQTLVEAGTATGGTLKYSLTSGSGYTENIPVKKDAGTYTVYYKVFGDSDHYDSEEAGVSITIKRAPVTVRPDEKEKLTGEEDPELTAAVTGIVEGESAEIIRYTLSRKSGEDAGKYEISASGEETQGNYSVEYGKNTFYIYKKSEETLSENTIPNGTGKIESKVVTYDTGENDGFAVSDVTIPAELAAGLLDETEKQAVEAGETLTVTLEIKEKASGDTTGGNEEAKAKAEAEIKKSTGTDVSGSGMILDIKLYKQVGNGIKQEIEPEKGTGKIAFTIEVPVSMRNDDEEVIRTFFVVHLFDDGRVEIASSGTDTALPVETDRLSSWYLTYVDQKKDNGGENEEGKTDDNSGISNDAAEKKVTVSDNKPMDYRTETKGSLRISYCHELPFWGKSKAGIEVFGEKGITVSVNNATYKVTKVKINKKTHRFQITGLSGADKKTEREIKKATKGSNGLSYKSNPYYVRNTDSLTVKWKKNGSPKSVKVMINGKDYKAKKEEWSYSGSSKTFTFKGSNLTGSYASR